MTVYYGKNKNNIILILRPNWQVHSQHDAVYLQKINQQVEYCCGVYSLDVVYCRCVSESLNPSLDPSPNLTQVSKNMISGNTRAYSFRVTTTALSVAFQSGNDLSLSLTWALHWHSSEHNYQATFHSTSLELFIYQTPSEVTELENCTKKNSLDQGK